MIKPKAVIIKDVIVYDFSILDIGFLVISQYKKRKGIYINNENPSKNARWFNYDKESIIGPR